jgi:2-oxoglutarate dehydrogenase E1 component
MVMRWQIPNALYYGNAQFGDFAKGCSNIIDQFIAAGEQKWNRMNGILYYLPPWL